MTEGFIRLTFRIVLVSGRIREQDANVFWLEVNHALVITRFHYEDSTKLDRECLDHADGW